MGFVSVSPESPMDAARKIATAEALARHYEVELFECQNEKASTKQQSRCPLPGHPQKGNGKPDRGKKLRWYFDGGGSLRFWKCFNAACRAARDEHSMGNDAVAFVAYMEGVSRQEAADLIIGGLLTPPSPSTN